MSEFPIVLLAPRVTPDSVRVWEAATALGWKVKRLASWRAPEDLGDSGDDIVLYAEPLFAEAISDQLGLILLEPPPDWLSQLPFRFRKRRISFASLRDCRTLREPTFVKPAEGKVFEAKVYQSGSELPSADAVDETLSVLCSEPVNFKIEARSFVRNRQVLDMSPYWRDGVLAQDEAGEWTFVDNEESEARQFIEEVLSSADVDCPPAFVLDVGYTSDRGWAVIEANPCWGAGLYGCSASSALQACRIAIELRDSMGEAMWRWTSPRVKRVVC